MKHIYSQLSYLAFIIVLTLSLITLGSCFGNKDEAPVIPPVTSPLSKDYIGFGVITASFTHITVDPADNSSSLGYLRRGSLVKVIRRQLNRTPEGFVYWVLVNGEQQGWLKEEVMEIYINESQARTASESMLK
ncbi:MAG: hypothetical protein FWD24_04980 [Treponema sp.]|nr:hypothetical protein [Treponema sp.]